MRGNVPAPDNSWRGKRFAPGTGTVYDGHDAPANQARKRRRRSRSWRRRKNAGLRTFVDLMRP